MHQKEKYQKMNKQSLQEMLCSMGFAQNYIKRASKVYEVKLTVE